MGRSWVEAETTGCDLGDVRLNRRLGAMFGALGEHPGKSLPTAFQDWSNTNAAYRFFSNENVSEDKILEVHFAASALRISATDDPILILQDTTEFSFKRTELEKVGFIEQFGRGRHRSEDHAGRVQHGVEPICRVLPIAPSVARQAIAKQSAERGPTTHTLRRPAILRERAIVPGGMPSLCRRSNGSGKRTSRSMACVRYGGRCVGKALVSPDARWHG